MQHIIRSSSRRLRRGRGCFRRSRLSSPRRYISSSSEAIEEYTITSNDNAATIQEELESIVRPYFEAQRPVVVRGAVAATPATNLWNSWSYWHETFPEDDETMVAVEIGGSYGTEQSERAEIPFQGYLQYLKLFEEQHGCTGNVSRDSWDIPSKDLVYMAQNDLPLQLHKDIYIPDFCQSGEAKESDKADTSSSPRLSLGHGHLYSVMLWLGPRGCVSPMHFDPLDNCLMQHMGSKRVMMFEPSSAQVGWHYAGHNGQQTNTSPINPEVLDEDGSKDDSVKVREQYPLFFEEGCPPRLECLLEPGDLLYIPSKWWHHVRSIDSSASVNVWWR